MNLEGKEVHDLVLRPLRKDEELVPDLARIAYEDLGKRGSSQRWNLKLLQFEAVRFAVSFKCVNGRRLYFICLDTAMYLGGMNNKISRNLHCNLR